VLRYSLLDPPVRLIVGKGRPTPSTTSPRPPEPARAPRSAGSCSGGDRGRKALERGIGCRTAAWRRDLGGATLTPHVELPFTNEEAEYLIGLAFRRSLQSLLYVSQGREDLGVLLTERRALRRLPVYEEIGDYSFAMYFYAFLFPSAQARRSSTSRWWR
jgi:hypothetical protein